MMNKLEIMKTDNSTVMLQMLNNVIKTIAVLCLNNADTENSVKKKRNYVIKSHENDNDDDDFKHVCIIAVFLLVKLLYLFIHSLDYLFRSIQTLAMLTDLIDLVAVPSSITCCSLNLPLKSIPSHCKC